MAFPVPRNPRKGKALDWSLAILGITIVGAMATIPLDPLGQGILAVLSTVVFLVCNRFKGQGVTMFLIMLSLAVSLRYIVWRVSVTLNFNSFSELMLGSALALAEMYAVIVLVLGYIQTAWPLNRKPVPLPPNPGSWPTVDVFIPTYDESLTIVRSTVLGCMGMDYPKEKLRIHLLDDGRRTEMRDFAAQCGINYVTRKTNEHAKAGNLNAAMKHTDGAFIAIFDCDHIPTRAFLQMTMGWLVQEPNLALVQTPHHFYSPDPFQRNLAAGTRVPSEGNMFYGLIQEGNDYWNAAFFCGSCAVLRRKALETIGGFATQTVTEDAHTMLKLHRKGWDSAYLKLPLAAGLATERLSTHIGQRIRWARGMLQILRFDNPMTGPGLTMGQRICYLQGMGHFLFAVPRITFLVAPLGYLLLDQNIIAASPLAIISYALPHVFHSVATNSRIQGKWRHSFWSEVYETVLALFLVRVTIATLWNPHKGKFNVTAKGGILEYGYFDLRAVYPNLIMLMFLMEGVIRGVTQLIEGGNDTLTFQALLLNTIWATFSLVTVLCALATARESRQMRTTPRIDAQIPVAIKTPHATIAATTQDVSLGGCRLSVGQPAVCRTGERVDIEFKVGHESLSVPATVLKWEEGTVKTSFSPDSIKEEGKIVKAVFGRADAWTGWSDYENDKPTKSLWKVLVSITGMFSRESTVAALALAVGLAALAPGDARAQTAPPGERTVTLTLKELGARGPIALRGTSLLQGVKFGIRSDEVVSNAALDIVGASSPALIPSASNDTVTVNDQYVGTIPVTEGNPNFSVHMPINPAYLQGDNKLNFEFTGRTKMECEDPLSGLLWSTVYERSTMTMTLHRTPPNRQLSRLPLPFFDYHEKSVLRLPFMLSRNPTNDELKSAAIVASWFGKQADFRGTDFPVVGTPPQGNAIMIAVGDNGHPGVALSPLKGPTLAVVANPADPMSSLLVVAGRTPDETVVAATALAIGNRMLDGPESLVAMPDIPARVAYDAPSWIPTDRPVKIGELAEPSDLESRGYTGLVRVPFRTAPDFYAWNGKLIPEVVRWHAPQGPIIDVAPSRVDVGINGNFLKSFGLAQLERDDGFIPTAFRSVFGDPLEGHLGLPTYDIFGRNDLEFYFDARPIHRADCSDIPNNLRMSIDPESTIDFSGAYRFTTLPNLAFFVESGFPFTKYADLSQTAVVLPETLSAPQTSAFLDMMGHLGSMTGYPVLQVTVARSNETASLSDKDILLMGTLEGIAPASGLLANSPFHVDSGHVTVSIPESLTGIFRMSRDEEDEARQRAAARLSTPLGATTSLLVGAQSPLSSGRSIVALVSETDTALPTVVASFRDTSKAPDIKGDMAILTPEAITSYSVGSRYTVGYLPPWLWPSWTFRDQPHIIIVFMMLGSAALALSLRYVMRRRSNVRLSK